MQRYFVYGNYIDEVLLMTDTTGQSNVDHYYAHNHLYSPAALIADDGTVEERYEYDAYGALTRFDPDFTTWSGTPVGNPYFFTGRKLDELDNNNFEIMYYRNRYYSPINGRFLSHDLFGLSLNSVDGFTLSPYLQYTDGLSLYQYTGSNPLIRFDPSGNSFKDKIKCFIEWFLAVIGYGAGGGEAYGVAGCAAEAADVFNKEAKRRARMNSITGEEDWQDTIYIYDPITDTYELKDGAPSSCSGDGGGDGGECCPEDE